MATEILIIDDNADIRNILDELIQDAGYKTRVAANFNQGLSEIDKKNTDAKTRGHRRHRARARSRRMRRVDTRL